MFLFSFLLFLFSLKLKETLAVFATGLPWGWNQVYSPTVFLGFSILALTHRVMFIHRFLDQFLDTSSTKKKLHPQFWILSFHPLSRSPSLFYFCVLIALFLSLAPALPLLHSLWFSLCLFPILLLLFWCVSRSVIQRIGGGGVDASESHLSPWHWRAQSQREGWAFPTLRPSFLSFLFKCIHTCRCSKTHHGQLMVVISFVW